MPKLKYVTMSFSLNREILIPQILSLLQYSFARSYFFVFVSLFDGRPLFKKILYSQGSTFFCIKVTFFFEVLKFLGMYGRTALGTAARYVPLRFGEKVVMRMGTQQVLKRQRL